MEINKHIVVATLGLMMIGVIKHYSEPNIPLTRVFVGSFVVLLALSVADLAGGQVSKFAGAIAMLALVNGIVSDIPGSAWSKLGVITSSTSGIRK